MSGRPAPQVVLFDLGNVLLPFDQERRIAALARRFGCADAVARAFMADGIHWRLSLGEADEADLADAFTAAFGERVEPAEAAELVLSVFEAPNQALWELVERLRQRAVVGGFSDNPRFVERLFPAGAFLEPMFFSSDLHLFKPEPAAFAAVEAGVGAAPEAILFIDDTFPNFEAARSRGWDAIHFTGNAPLMAELMRRGLS